MQKTRHKMVCPLCVLFLRRDGEKTASRWSFFHDATQEKFRHGVLHIEVAGQCVTDVYRMCNRKNIVDIQWVTILFSVPLHFYT